MISIAHHSENIMFFYRLIRRAHLHKGGGCLCGVMVKVMSYEIVVSNFELQSRYYIHFQTNTLRKDMSPLILPAMG